MSSRKIPGVKDSLDDWTVEEIVEMLWTEYRHGLAYMDPPRLSTTFLQGSGHAQSALNILARLGQSTEQDHMDLANAMQFVIMGGSSERVDFRGYE
jgi:hypothetical protein